MYIRLRALRAVHGLFQKDLGEIIGVSQTVLSRMEKAHKELDDDQYNRLVERFGEAEVSKFIGQPPVLGDDGQHKKHPLAIPDELTVEQALVLQAQTIKILTESNHIQQKTIETQAALIAWLKDKLNEK